MDVPFYEKGKLVRDALLEFEDGEVVSVTAEQNEAALRSIVETDEGSNRLGEFGIGTNREIDRVTYNCLFDEKMIGTVHFALGRAIGQCVPEHRERNQSDRHVDMIVDISEDSRVTVDGEVIQRNGVFAFEEAFE